MKSFSFDPPTAAVNVVTIYETSPTTQEDVLDTLKASKAIKKAPGFKGLSILQSEDGSRIISLFQQSTTYYTSSTLTALRLNYI